ncbi:hypothetical protein D3C74_55060 [compost metagenome]
MEGNVTRLKRSVKMKPIGKEGLLKGEDGKVIRDDSWMHPEVLDEQWDRKHTSSMKRAMSKSTSLYVSLPRKIGLYLDLNKAMDTTKLVKKPIQVHGENGKTFTRMQWVDPNTGQPVSQKHAVDAHVKGMSTEEKYDMMDKHNIQHKHNDHPSILHKNKVEALKQHLYNNPHLVGAEHNPKHSESTPSGTDKVNHWVDGFAKNDREKLYEMMKKFGIAESDPRIDNPDDKAHPIKHMHNMMKLKKHLKDNPHYMEHDDYQPRVNKPHSPTSSVKTKAETGGNTIDGILKTLSRSELYSMMKTHGIAEADPMNVDPDNKANPIKHMHNMMKFKKLVESNPRILNLDSNHSIASHREERSAGMDDNQKHVQAVKDLLDSSSPELKLKWADQHKDHTEMQKRITSDHQHIDNMHKVSALRKILESNPDLLDKYQSESDHEQLMGLTIGNKNMGKVLRNFLGLKGVGDVNNVEPGVEWSYKTGFVRRELDDNNKPILSVVDTGKDGEEWNEHTIDLSEVRKFLGDKKESSALKSLSSFDIINWGW